MEEKNGVVYVGIPLKDNEDNRAALVIPTTSIITTPTLAASSSKQLLLNTTTQQQQHATSSSHSSTGNGLLAFLVGAVLASFGWVANQGWTIVSLLLFGQFTWTFESAWKHILLCIFGALCTAIAFWAVFKLIFPSVLLVDDDDEEDEDENNRALVSSSSSKRDISNALQDLGELGFVVGYFGSQAFLASVVYKPLIVIGIEYTNDVSVSLNCATMVFVLLWMLCTKMRDYNRAVKRAAAGAANASTVVELQCDVELEKPEPSSSSSSSSLAYAQMMV